MANYETLVEKDLPNKTIRVVREFNCPIERLWAAWTQANLLDQWWAPRPFKAVTQSMDFKAGGLWLYYMLGPAGERHYCRVAFTAIEAGRSFSAMSNFCDEHGNITGDMPTMYWKIDFSDTATGSKVDAHLKFETETGLETILQMGFQEGFTAAHTNLDELLEA